MLFGGAPVSIDIGSRSVKVAQVHHRRGVVRLIRYAEERLPSEFHWEAGGDRSALIAAIRTAMARAGIRARSAIMSLPRRHVTARISPFPPAERAQLRRVVEYDLSDHVPFAVDQVVMDLQSLGASREQPGLTDVMVVAAQREFVRQHLDLARRLGLRLVTLTVDSLALHDLTRRMDEGPVGLTLTVDIGYRSATINVSQAGRLWLTRSVPLGGEQLTAAIRGDLGLTAEEAEARKITEGIPGQTGDGLGRDPRFQRVSAWLENLCGELRRSGLSFGQAAVSRVFLLGAGSRVPGLAEAIARELGVTPISPSLSDLFPYARIRDDTSAPWSCLLAIGQALRGSGQSVWTISLLPPELAQRRRRRQLRMLGASAGAAAVAALIVGYLLSAGAIGHLEVQKKDLQEDKAVADEQQAQVAELLSARDQLRAQVETVIAAPRRRYAALELLRTISQAASPEVRLVAFTMGEEQPLVIRGTAPDPGAVADLETALSASPLVTEVSVENATRTFERPGRLAGPRTTRREETRSSESVSFVIKARLWSKPKQQAKTAALARPGGAE